ncbi:MAG: glycine cleavage system protein H [Bryobacterales bacterium]|nr:glycine cleavage system protein H [Bryobacterales bacterium]
MTVILVLLTFAAFILLDWILEEKPVVTPMPEVAATHARVTPLLDSVEGFHTPANVRYHPGHTWILRERKGYARVGMDEFAAALSGGIERLELPRSGQWIRQGQRVIAVTRQGERVELVSPTEGEVVEINEEVLRNPALLRQQPYEKGWLFAVHVPDEESTSRNLVPTNLVRAWMSEAVHAVYALQPQAAGAIAADGARPAADLLANLPEIPWQSNAAEFFLTRNHEKPAAAGMARELQS